MISKTWGNGLGGVVLDAVGTLIEPEPGVAAVYAAAAARQGVVLDRAVVKGRFHRFFREDDLGGALATDEATELRRWRRLVANVLPELPDGERGFAELWAHFARPESWRVFDDVGPALRSLAGQGVRVSIASNFDGRLRAVVRGLPAISARVLPMVLSSEVGYRKPHREFYWAACRRLGLEPHRVLCAGDDRENDWDGPRRAGLHACLVDRDGHAPHDVPCFPDLGALVQAILR